MDFALNDEHFSIEVDFDFGKNYRIREEVTPFHLMGQDYYGPFLAVYIVSATILFPLHLFWFPTWSWIWCLLFVFVLPETARTTSYSGDLMYGLCALNPTYSLFYYIMKATGTGYYEYETWYRSLY